MLNFLVRLVLYALLLGLSARVAQTLWTSNGLDTVAALQPLHDTGFLTLAIAPLVLALLGVGVLRSLCVFAACFLAAAAITAPIVLARLVTAGA
ncbi:hypothetical protein WPS_34830 [Vulcanimicrobium alpinum]|uniref:Uncharacterized protein n=1 Tax=Vulcanimicrobium alpinum TaxID=3016050 RepID=A0AAN1XZE5_UNVUL|nr:hypothetical protein [Vulcanimicrobium alpinum]BDE08207.1 hypothetical protein WPS_34830 [Vulcanimicrobium alpinum]